MNTPALDLGSLGLPAAPAAAGGQDLGQADFLALMTTQLQHQDPFEPMESGQFLGQMAQFSTVSGIGDLNQRFAELADSLNANQALQGSGLVGQTVTLAGDRVHLGADGGLRGAAQGAAAGERVVFDVVDANGETLHSSARSADASGRAEFDWDGRLADGSRAAPGSYRRSARAESASGTRALSTVLSGRVDSVTLGGASGLQLNVDGLGSVRLADVLQVS